VDPYELEQLEHRLRMSEQLSREDWLRLIEALLRMNREINELKARVAR
jgi:hypothetical protein